MAKIIWSEKAAFDLEQIHDYIAADTPFYARLQIERIFKSVEQTIDRVYMVTVVHGRRMLIEGMLEGV